MKFLADRMLGKLAKWLRFLGYDTLYPEVLDDDELIQISKSESRVLLTRDRTIAQSKRKLEGVPAICYVESENVDHQLEQVIKDLNLEIGDKILTRCAECNGELTEVDKNAVQGHVARGVFERQDKFWQCPGCRKYYWEGSHYDKITKKIAMLKGK